MKRIYENDYLIEILKEYAFRLGKTPTYNVFENDKTVPSATIYKQRFGTWNNALALAGLKTNAIRKYKKEDIIKEVLSYYEKNDRAPFYNELKFTTVHVNKFWDGWTAMLEDLNIPLNRRFSLVTSEEELLVFLKELADKLEVVPTGKDIEEAGINRNLFTQKFGSYKSALIKAGVVKEEYFKTMEERVPDSIAAILTFYNQNGEAPSVEEYEIIAKQENLAHRKALEMILEKRFTEICMEHLGVANQYKRSKEQLLEDLKNLKDKLGRTPMANELTANGLAEKKQYYRTFNMTYNQIIESLGWELTSNKMHFKSIDELLEDYKKLHKEIGRIPFYDDIKKEDWMASHATYKKYFTDLPTIWRTLNISVDEELMKSFGTGTACIDNKGGVCRSYPEMIITNILLDLELKFEKEILYKEFIPGLKNKISADWVLTVSNTVIEYFGLFSNQQLNEDNFIGRYSKNVLHKLSLCKKHKVILIDLYPEDLEDIEEVIIEKLQYYKII